MKKYLFGILILVLSVVLVSCTKPSTEKEMFVLQGNGFYHTEFSSMDTVISFNIHKSDKEVKKRNEVATKIKDNFDNIHNLTDNFSNDNKINNIYYINNNPSKKIEIDKVLYDLLVLSEEIKVDTYGYFDISIGKIIDVWKDLLNKSSLSNNDLLAAYDKVDSIPVIKDGIKLESSNDKYYVTISEGVKIDLGAIAKGYAVDRARDIARTYKLEFFEIRGSDSSVYYGKTVKPNRDFFTVGLNGPLDFENDNPSYGRYYEVIKAKDIAVTTSGDAIQNAEIGDVLIHHIISPVSKRPENLRRMMTIVNDNATISDALTTALFSMPDETFNKWIEGNDEYSVIFLNSDYTIKHYNVDNYLFPL